MHTLNYKRRAALLLIPLLGILTFIILYFIAASLYPGGSQVDANATGFSWLNNYWCNLLSENAINGQQNPGRIIALLSMMALCFSMSVFWYVFPQLIAFKNNVRFIIQVSGTASMVIGMFLFTPLHDIIINLAGIFGLVALIGTYAGLYKSRWHLLFYFGLFNLFLIAVNNYVYFTKGLIIYLPVIQKITFASFLAWICCIDIGLYKLAKSAAFNSFPKSK